MGISRLAIDLGVQNRDGKQESAGASGGRGGFLLDIFDLMPLRRIFRIICCFKRPKHYLTKDYIHNILTIIKNNFGHHLGWSRDSCYSLTNKESIFLLTIFG